MAKEANPIPQGKYVPATRFGNMIFTAGMTPRNNGVLIRTGKVKASDDIADYKDAVVQAAKNALTAAKNKLEEGEKRLSISARSLGNPVLEAARLSVLRFFREKLRWRSRSLRG